MEQYFAQVTNGVVTNVVVATTEFMAENPERYLGEWIETFLGTGVVACFLARSRPS